MIPTRKLLMTRNGGKSKTPADVAKRSSRRLDTKKLSIAGTTTSLDGSKPAYAAFSIEEVVETVIGYLPSKQQQKSCTLVSKLWNRVVLSGRSMPLVLRIEDTDPQTSSAEVGDVSEDEVFHFPLHAICRLPAKVAIRTTKLILVLRFVKAFADKYNLNDFARFQGKPCNFLDRFPNLQDLTIISEYAADQFVSVLSVNNSIPSLKRIRYEETNVSNWRSSYLQSFVKLAPNLQVLELRENMVWQWSESSEYFQAEDISELLPLAGSLRELVLFNRPNIGGNFATFFEQMPLLNTWDIFSLRINMMDWPVHYGRSYETFGDNTFYQGINRSEYPHFLLFLQDEVEFFRMMQDIFVRWFLELDDPNLHPWKTKIPSMVGYLDALVREYFGSEDSFFENRPVRPYTLPTLKDLLQVDPNSMMTTTSASRKYSSYCSPSRKAKKFFNYRRVFQPCMKIYHKEFLYYSKDSNFLSRYNRFQTWHQHLQLRSLIRKISHANDGHRWKIPFLFARKANDFRFLI